MQCIYRPALVVGAALALASCGGGDGSSNGSSQKPSGQAPETSAATPPSTTSPAAPPARQRSPDRDRSSGSGGSKRTSPGGTAPSQTGGSPGSTSGQSGTNSSPTEKRPKPKTKQERADAKLTPGQTLYWRKKFYDDARVGCRVLGPERIRTEYKAESLAPVDVARAYARAFVDSFQVEPPSFTYHQTYEGCLSYLRRAAAR